MNDREIYENAVRDGWRIAKVLDNDRIMVDKGHKFFIYDCKEKKILEGRDNVVNIRSNPAIPVRGFYSRVCNILDAIKRLLGQ